MYLTKMIRAGFEKADVDMFAAVCQQAKTDIGDSREHLYILLDMARHNNCDVLDIVKTGRVSSGQKNINQAFIDAIFTCMASDEECEPSTKVLDLTAESESGSYEEEERDDTPNSRDAYEIDGFVVEDIEDADDDVDDKPRKLKRSVTQISRP